MTENPPEGYPTAAVTQDVYWAQVPEWVLFHPDLQDKDVRVFAALQRYAGASGTCWPGLDTLGERLGCHVDSVRRSIGRLDTAGAVTVEARHDNGRQLSNRYRLHMHPRGTALASVQPPGVASTRPESVPEEREPPQALPHEHDATPAAALTGRAEEVIQVMLRVERERSGPVKSRTRWEDAVKRRLRDEHGAEAVRLTAKYPTAPPDVIAGQLNGDGNALRYYPPEA